MKKSLRLFSLLLSIMLFAAPFTFSARAEKKSGVVRVLLTKLNLTDQMDVSLDGSYTLNDIAFQRGSHLKISCATGDLMVYYEGMALNAGKELVLLRHETGDGQENGLRVNGKYELHPGDLHLSIQQGQLQAVLYAPVEEYLLGVVPYEMSDSFPLEALKAQAVAARTYALKKTGASGGYDLVDNTNDQAYTGIKAENKNAAQAVRETEGLCGYYQDALAECYYSASNGGQTELASHVWGQDYPYLIMEDDPYDLENPESTVKRVSFPKVISSPEQLGGLQSGVFSALPELLESRGYDGDLDYIRVTGIQGVDVALPQYTDSPTKVMTLLRLHLTVEARRLITEEEEEDISIFDVMSGTVPTSPPGDPGEKKEQWSNMEPLPESVLVTMDIFPDAEQALDLSINSSRNEIWSVRETESAFILEARRFGHGVGMSQRGAQRMAEAYHWTYDQILRFYYPGMKIQRTAYDYSLAAPLQSEFLTTPGPAATPTPRPTVIPVLSTPAPTEYKVQVTNIGVNSYLNLRAAPSTQADVLQQLYFGQVLIVVKEEGDWLAVRTDDLTGYVMKEYVKELP